MDDMIRSFFHGLLGSTSMFVIESVIAALSYLFGAFVQARSRDSSPWHPMIALVPFSALISIAATGAFILYFFIASGGGAIGIAYLPLATLAAAFLGSRFGAWAVAPRGLLFRVTCTVTAIVVAAYLVAVGLRTAGYLA